MTFRMIAQLWNTNTPAIVSGDADLTENYMYISSLEREFMYFAGKLVYLIVRASNKLAINRGPIVQHIKYILYICMLFPLHFRQP